MGGMECIYTELALYGSKYECARTDTVFLPISEVCDGKVSLMFLDTFLITSVSGKLTHSSLQYFQLNQ